MNLTKLEIYIDQVTLSSARPFMFKLRGQVERATIHIVNLAPGTRVSAPADVHKQQINYQLDNQAVDILGFFSTEHKTIFTHHDTFLHLHLMTSDRKKMGHLDEVSFKPGTMTLYLPRD